MAPEAALVESPVATPDPAPASVETQTEAPVEATPEAAGAAVEDAPSESAAAEDAPAAAEAPQLDTGTSEPEAKPQYMTRDEWEKEKASVAASAAREALELDQRRRQSENARRDAQAKKDADNRAELSDVVRAIFIQEQGYEPPAEKVALAIDRFTSKREDQYKTAALDDAAQALEYWRHLAEGKPFELDNGGMDAAKRLAPTVQTFLDIVRPQIEAKAREGYFPEAELPSRIEAAIDLREAKGREGKVEKVTLEASATGGPERGSRDWWSALGPEGRKDKANQTLYDDWIRRNA